MAAPVIEVEHLSKRYGSIVAIEDLSFEVEKSEIFGILGPNGAGKTTAIECLEGLREPKWRSDPDAGSRPPAPVARASPPHRMPAPGVRPTGPDQGVGGARPVLCRGAGRDRLARPHGPVGPRRQGAGVVRQPLWGPAPASPRGLGPGERPGGCVPR